MGYSKKCPAQKRHSKRLIFSLDKLVIKHLLCAKPSCRGWVYSRKQNQVPARMELTFYREMTRNQQAYTITLGRDVCYETNGARGTAQSGQGGI